MNKALVLFFFLFIHKAEAQQPSALNTADSLYSIGSYQEAIKQYKAAGTNAAVQFKIASSYQLSGNQSKALQTYKEALQENPDAVVATYKYGMLLQDAGYLAAADSVFEVLTKQYPNNVNFRYQWAAVKEEANDSLALPTYFAAYALDSTHLNTNYKLAKYGVTKRNFSGAQKYIDFGLQQDQASTRFLTLQGLSDFYEKKYHLAIKSFENLLALNHGNEQLHEKLAMSYSNTNQFEKAIAQYTILINRYDDKVPKYHINLSKAYVAIKEYDKAIRHAEIAIVLQDIPLDSEYLMLSTIYKRKEDPKMVFEMLSKAVVENPEDEMIQYFRALAADNYFKDIQTIITYYERYLQKFGDTGRYRELVRQRVKDLKEDLFFEKE